MRRILALGSAVVFLSLFCVPLSWARLTVAPHLTVREEYNDNIFLRASNEESDFITTVRPGLAFSWPSKYLHLDLDYGFHFLILKDHTELNETRISDAQRGRLNAELFPDHDFSVFVKDEISRVVIDQRVPSSTENIILNQTNLNHFFVNPQYRFRSIPTVEATLGYQYENLSYKSGNADDSNTQSGTFDLTKDFSSRFKMFLNYGIHFHHAQISEGYRRQDLSGGFSYKLSPRLTFVGSGGATRTDFKDTGSHTYETWLAQLIYRATDRTLYSLEGSNSFFVSVDNGLFQRQAVNLVMRYKGKVISDIRLFANEDTYRSVNREDRSVGGLLAAAIPLVGDIRLSLNGNYTYYRFLPQLEDIKRFGVGGGLEYVHKIYFCSLGYLYQKGINDNGSNEYRDNIVYIQAGINYGAIEKDNKFLSSIK